MSAPMTRCECHNVPFSEVARYADRHPGLDFPTLIARVGCGQTCTACHCDLKIYLREHAREATKPRTLVPATPVLAGATSL